MSVKVLKEAKEKRSEHVQKILHRPSTVRNTVTSRPSPVLSDKNEFPSLDELTVKSPCNSYSTEKILKYSDKLKSNFPSKTQGTLYINLHSKSDSVVTNAPNSHNDEKCNMRSSFTKKEYNQTIKQENSDRPRFVHSSRVNVNSSPNIPKQQINKSPNQKLPQVSKKDTPQQKHANFKGKTSRSAKVDPISKSNNQSQSSKPLESTTENEEGNDNPRLATKKKKKRKSKVKRQVAYQSGKITVLTPEVHSKILKQANAVVVRKPKRVLTDINDEEEYPELGKPAQRANTKGNNSGKDVSTEVSMEPTEKLPDTHTDHKPSTTEDVKDSSAPCIPVKAASQKKTKKDGKTAVHPNDPITISFFDILLNKNSKPNVKDFKEEKHVSENIGFVKVRTKKDTCQPHNLLDSSSPMIKRGKERENPKPKKPSKIKKIILLDRKIRKEHLLSLKGINPEGNDVIVNGSTNKLSTDDLLKEADSVEAHLETENSFNEIKEIPEETLASPSSSSDDTSSDQEEKTVDEMTSPSPDNEVSFEDSLLLKMEGLSISEMSGQSAVLNDLSCACDETEEHLDNSDSYKESESEDTSVITSVATEMPSDSAFSSEDAIEKSEIADKEKAAKILLHTRHFREYCNHLISKDIDEAVFSLLDNLARFQDRLHQKDPVKARIKRRMIYGIKEVKKYIKLKKLKCIIIAVDVENVETQGGLNDILNDIKVSAADHHIPCVFALGRKVLGKLCRKPVPVSCVGVLNYEGSEANFKKMVELQAQSKVDYNEIFSKLMLKLSHDEATSLLKAKTEAPETLVNVRADILNNFFMTFKTDEAEADSSD